MTPLTSLEHLQAIESQRNALDSQEQLLRELPATLLLSCFFYSHGYWNVQAVGTAKELLALLPPCNATVELHDQSWRASPAAGPVDWERRLLPLWSSSTGLHWYHRLASGRVILVSAKAARLPEIPGYERLQSAHTAVLGRKLVPLSPRTGPLEHAQNSWESFFAQEQYDAKQLRFARALRVIYERVPGNLDKTMLPCAEPTQMLLAGHALEIRYPVHQAPPETLPPSSPMRGLLSIGRFWDAFTAEQADRLLEFSNKQPKSVKEQDDLAARAAMDTVKSAVAAFCERYLGAMRNAPDTSVLARWILEQTGYAVTVSWGLHLASKALPGGREVWLNLRRCHETVRIAFPLHYDPAGFDWQNPPFYQYEPNQAHF